VHGQSYWDFERPSVGKEKFLAWLINWGIKGEMESIIIIAAQDQTLKMHYH
jgi:hypothetical protein